MDAAQQAKITAVQDILERGAASGSGPELIQSLEAIFAGASAEDVEELRKVLLRQHLPGGLKSRRNPDEELSDDWRGGGYPYKNLMSRKNYEKQKYHLQVELLKLQTWVKETGQRIGILFEGRDAAGKGGTIKRFKGREAHPLKQWQLSPRDLASLDKWDDYTKAKEAVFFYTDTADSPWTVTSPTTKSAPGSTPCATSYTSCLTRKRTSTGRSARSAVGRSRACGV